MVPPSIQAYLESLPEAVIARLFRSPSTCLAVFRLLPSLAQTLLLSFLFVGGVIPISFIETYVKPDQRRLQLEAVQALKKTHIVKERPRSGTYAIHEHFGQSLRTALTSGPENELFGIPLNKASSKIYDQDFLRRYSQERQEQILHYMVGSSASSPGSKANKTQSQRVLRLLRDSDLMDGRNLDSLAITSAGFQFLLQDSKTQVWTLVLYYLGAVDSTHLDPVEVLNFILMLGALELGQIYSLGSELNETQSAMLADLSELGFVYCPKNSPHGSFLTTPLASALINEVGSTTSAETSANSNAQESLNKGIIIETNYRLYAYTDSPLQIAILNLFCHLKSRFPNLVVGRLSRESIRRALRRGITADQIIQYLSSSAHEHMRTNAGTGPVIPSTISDQIKLWQLEMDRLRASPGYLYSDFSSMKEYNLIMSYARDVGALLWCNDAKRIFFVDRESNSQVIDYINRKMSGASM